MEYTETLNQIDTYISGLYSLVEERRNNGEDWLVVFVSDHGGDGFGHGDSSNPHINRTLLIVDHPTINFNTNYVSKY